MDTILGGTIAMTAADGGGVVPRCRPTSWSPPCPASPTPGEGTPRILNRPTGRTVLTGPDDRRDVRDGLVTATLGDDGAHLSDLAADGLVVAAFGVGHVPAGRVAGTARRPHPRGAGLAHRGRVRARRHLRLPRLRARPAVPGADRRGVPRPLKARILLHGLLGTRADAETTADAFGRR